MCSAEGYYDQDHDDASSVYSDVGVLLIVIFACHIIVSERMSVLPAGCSHNKNLFYVFTFFVLSELYETF